MLDQQSWQHYGRILAAPTEHTWLQSHTGSTCFISANNAQANFYLTGRDQHNQSRIGTMALSLEPKPMITKLSRQAVIPLGSQGEFDQHGTSYPFYIEHQGQKRLYYVGWRQHSPEPFINHIGVAMLDERGQYQRKQALNFAEDGVVSRGAFCILIENNFWRMWYAAFLPWQERAGHWQHFYRLHYAESEDGLHWRAHPEPAIDFCDSSEYAITHPTIVKLEGVDGYHMWFCARGEAYHIHYAHSADGKVWQRERSKNGINLAGAKWDARMQCYPRIFKVNNDLYLLYAGNDYGQAGLGLARLEGSNEHTRQSRCHHQE